GVLPRGLRQWGVQTGLPVSAACPNCAVLYAAGADKGLRSRGLQPQALHRAAASLEAALPGCGFGAERVGHSAYDHGAVRFVSERGYHNPWGDPDETLTPRADVLAAPAVKLLASDPERTSDEMATAARAVLDTDFDVTFSTGGGLIEISHHHATKATGLADIVARLGIPAADAVAFGDMPNDIAMLRWAGHGIAVANAHPSVHANADAATAANSEDGVAQALERWFH